MSDWGEIISGKGLEAGGGWEEQFLGFTAFHPPSASPKLNSWRESGKLSRK